MNNLLPPHDRKLELELLSCVLQDKRNEFVHLLQLDWFYEVECRMACQAMMALAARGDQVDVISLGLELKARGGMGEINPLTFAGDLERLALCAELWHSLVPGISDLARKRAILSTATQSASAVYDPAKDSTVILEDLEQSVFNIRQSGKSRTLEPGDNRAVLRDLVENWRKSASGQELPGFKTGYSSLDAILGRIRTGNFVVVGARPGQGKSALLMGIAWNWAKNGIPCLFVSCEMTHAELMERLVCGISRVRSWDLETGRVDSRKQAMVLEATNRVKNAPLHIVQAPVLTAPQLLALCRREIQIRGCKAVFVDYLQLMRTAEKTSSRYEMMTNVSNGLKRIGIETGLPVIAAAQLNRQADEAEAPQLMHLKESGSIEADADKVILLHTSAGNASECQEVTLRVCKNRRGAVGDSTLIFNRPLTLFEEPCKLSHETRQEVILGTNN